jgi:hypothetical protein
VSWGAAAAARPAVPAASTASTVSPRKKARICRSAFTGQQPAAGVEPAVALTRGVPPAVVWSPAAQ